MTVIIIFSLFLTIIHSQDDPDAPKNILIKSCKEQEVLLTKNESQFFKIVEIPTGFKLQLQCRYCREPDDEKPKNWYRINNFNESNIKEVELDMNNDVSRNRVMVNHKHSLIIMNVNQNDSAEYICRSLSDSDNNEFNFLVQIVFEEEVRPETGNLVKWEIYNKESMHPTNNLFITSAGIEYVYLREQLQLHSELITEWDEFGPCELCGRPRNDGIRRRVGRCRLKLTPTNANLSLALNLSDSEVTLVRSGQISCRSIVLNELVPGVSNITRLIPDFVLTEHCEGTCNPDADGTYRGWQSTKKSGFKFRKTFVLAEGSHITIICPESTLENVVQWKHNGKVLKAGSALYTAGGNEPRISVDTFNTLYLYDVMDDQEGNYTCYVDNVRMQQVIVFVVSKSKLLTQAFVRHMMYLAFVLSLTLSCYCAGLVITWTRRKKFKSFEELWEQHKLLNDADDYV